MEVKKSYKETEVGLIPVDWEIFSLKDVCIKIRDGNYGWEYPKPHEFVDYGIPFLTSKAIGKDGTLKDDLIDFISPEKHMSLDKAHIELNDVLFTNRGASVGAIGFVDNRIAGGNIGPQLTLLRVNPNLVTSKYLFHSMKSNVVQKQIKSQDSGSAMNFYSIAATEKFQFPLPPTLAEQEAIAEALSDADALIEAVEQLLAKKRQVKQGAMQRLLRPKEGWEPTNLGSIADPNKRWSFTGGPFGSNLKSSDYTDDGVRIIQLQNIGDGEFKDNYEVFTSLQKADELLSCNIYPGEIILSKMGDPVARACIIPPLHERYVMCSDGIRLSVDQKRFNTYFVYTVINAQDFRTKAENAGTGSTRKRIGLTELRNLELLCPPLPEQTAIAEILSDMDAEISALEEKLVKARQVKAGMMSELLTGKIRLV
jgi:type I restriction enzyme, S subunit